MRRQPQPFPSGPNSSVLAARLEFEEPAKEGAGYNDCCSIEIDADCTVWIAQGGGSNFRKYYRNVERTLLLSRIGMYQV